MIRIKIDNVARYAHSLQIQGEKDDDVNEFDAKHTPIVVLPFEECEFFYKHNGWSYKVAATGYDIKEENVEDLKAYYAHSEESIISGELADLSDARFLTILVAYAIGTNSTEKIGSMDCIADSAGEILESLTVADEEFIERIGDRAENIEQILYHVNHVIIPTLVAISFLHCKNIPLIDEPLSRQQRRMNERKGKKDTYKILDINPFKRQVNRETGPGQSKFEKAMHICRGHFATYTEERPLFGKHVGTYWVPMHVKGNKGRGTVTKDYHINLEGEEGT